jgi:nitrilase
VINSTQANTSITVASSGDSFLLRIGLAQIAPIWLDREATLRKIESYVEQAANEGCQLVIFGEALVPGYPFWLELTDGARFNSPLQKRIFAEYVTQSVQPEAGHLTGLCETAADRNIAIFLGCVERAADRGEHSLYCSLILIDRLGTIVTVHRKLMPTYEERLVWSNGDGYGLRTHPLGAFRVGGLSCWENWMPLARAALYAQGEDLHVSVWPGNIRNTRDITRFIALESRSYVVAVSGLLRSEDIGVHSEWRRIMTSASPEVLADGGSCVAGPDGEWVLPPVEPMEKLFLATVDYRRVLEERQNFDPSGHYARPDVTRLEVNRRRQGILKLSD